MANKCGDMYSRLKYNFGRRTWLKRSRTSWLALAPIATCTCLPPQSCKRGSRCPYHDDAAIVVNGETPPEKVTAPPVARRKLGGLLPSTIRLSPLPSPRAIETPHFVLLRAVNAVAGVVFLAADRRSGRLGCRGGRGRRGCVCVVGRNHEAGEHVDGSGARGVVLSGYVVGLRRSHSGCGNIGSPGARREFEQAELRSGLGIPRQLC